MDNQEKEYESLHKWMNDTSSDLDSKEDQHLSAILDTVSQLDTPASDVDQAWSSLQGKLATHTLAKRSKRKFSIGLAAAASVALVVVAGWWLMLGEQVTAIATSQATVEHILPDGSKLVLNRGSQVTYIASHWKGSRALELDGEAYFEVKKGSSFTVKTSAGEVKTLGTSFNVFHRGNALEVAVFTGKVKVSHGQQERILTASHKLVITDGAFAQNQTLAKEEYKGWRSGVYHFENEKLSVVLRELERQYGVTFQNIEQVGSELASGYIDTNLTLHENLVGMEWGLSFEIQDDEVTITKK